MFEQQIEETISSIKRKTIGDNASIPLKAVLAADIPRAVKTYFDLDVMQWMKEEHDRLLNSPHFDYSDDSLRKKFREIEQHSKPMIRFTGEEFDVVLDQAVKLHFNYICRPQWTLSKFVFGDKDLVTADAILDALNYFVEYDYFKLIITEYLETKNYGSMHRDRFEELVATIDNEVTKGFDSRKMAHLSEPLFMLFAGDNASALIPIEALSVFYDDKNVSPIVERLDAEKETMPMLSMHDLTVLISEVDFSTSVDISNLVNRHLYPEKQSAPAPQQNEPTDEELTRSIIAESRGEQQKAETPAAPPVTRDEEPDPEPEDVSFGLETEPESGAALPSFEEEETPITEFQSDPEPGEEPQFPELEEEEQPLPDFQIEEEQPAEEASLPEFEDEPQEEQLPDFSFGDEQEVAPDESLEDDEQEIPAFKHVPQEETTLEDGTGEDFSFSFGEESDETADDSADGLSDFSFGSDATPAEAVADETAPSDEFKLDVDEEEQPPAIPEENDMETPEAFDGFTLSPEEETEPSAVPAADDELDMPEEFEGFKLAPDETTEDELAPYTGEQEVPEFGDFNTESDSQAMPSFADADGIKEEPEEDTPGFDDFLPVETDTTPDTVLPADERLEETPADTDDDFSLDFNLGNEGETTQEPEQDTFDSFLSDLDEATGETPATESTGDDLSFLGDTGSTEAGTSEEIAFMNEDPATTPGDEFSFEGDFTPPESDISFEESGKLVNEEQKNEYSTIDETQFTEFEFEPPDDDSLILPELDLSLDEGEADMIANDEEAGGFDFGEELVAEQEAESKRNEMQDLMKDFARDQSVGDDAVDDPINTLGDLKQTIPAKDRKLYVKALFNKDEDAFEAALNELNRKPAWREASEYIDELFIEHDVDMYSKVAIKFTDEIYKRYMPKGK